MIETLDLLRGLGVPVGIATFIILAAIIGDFLIKRYAEARRIEGDETRAERKMLASDQADFRASLMGQVSELRKQLLDNQKALEASVARNLDAERRVVEFQLTIARLAAGIVSGGIKLPPESMTILSIEPPDHASTR